MVDCAGDQSCQSHRVFCAENQSCSVKCHANEACQQADFVQAATGTFKLDCQGDEACQEARVDRQCDEPNCVVTCNSDNEVCEELICTGSGCPM